MRSSLDVLRRQASLRMARDTLKNVSGSHIKQMRRDLSIKLTELLEVRPHVGSNNEALVVMQLTKRKDQLLKYTDELYTHYASLRIEELLWVLEKQP